MRRGLFTGEIHSFHLLLHVLDAFNTSPVWMPRHSVNASPPEVVLTNLDSTRRVSGHHARILQEGGHFFSEDLKALNPRRLHGASLPPSEKRDLHDGDTLRIGDLGLGFSLVQG